MMKQFMLSICLLCACTTLQAQGRKHTTFYDQRATLFEVLPTSKKDIIFLGNSITNGGEWTELLGNPHAKNRGISGDRTDGVLDRLHVITKGKPAKIFLLIALTTSPEAAASRKSPRTSMRLLNGSRRNLLLPDSICRAFCR